MATKQLPLPLGTALDEELWRDAEGRRRCWRLVRGQRDIATADVETATHVQSHPGLAHLVSPMPGMTIDAIGSDGQAHRVTVGAHRRGTRGSLVPLSTRPGSRR